MTVANSDAARVAQCLRDVLAFAAEIDTYVVSLGEQHFYDDRPTQLVAEALIHRIGEAVGEFARRSRTSQSTLSTYERGTKSPTLSVAERIVVTTGHELDLVPRVAFTIHTGRAERPSSSRTAPGDSIPPMLWRP